VIPGSEDRGESSLRKKEKDSSGEKDRAKKKKDSGAKAPAALKESAEGSMMKKEGSQGGGGPLRRKMKESRTGRGSGLKVDRGKWFKQYDIGIGKNDLRRGKYPLRKKGFSARGEKPG